MISYGTVTTKILHTDPKFTIYLTLLVLNPEDEVSKHEVSDDFT